MAGFKFLWIARGQTLFIMTEQQERMLRALETRDSALKDARVWRLIALLLLATLILVITRS